jgi:putative chitinase
LTVITPARLRLIAPSVSPLRAEAYAPALEGVRDRADLSTPRRVCHFLAQVAHETGGFSALTEAMAYRDPVRLDRLSSQVKGPDHAAQLIACGAEAIGNCVYGGRMGNGEAASGDGYRYRGRGFLMITGRSAYARVQTETGLPVLDQPQLLGQPKAAATAAALYWASREINGAADADDVRAVTALINGPACLGLADRARWLARVKAVFLTPPADQGGGGGPSSGG